MKYSSFDIQLEDYSRKFNYRPGTSDEGVIQQIFIQEDYSLAKIKRFADLVEYSDRHTESGRSPLIVDAGANIGASSVYFALKYPAAKIIAVEPGADNYRLLSLNSEGLHIEPRLGAVASKTGFMNVIDVGEGFWGLRTELAIAKTSGSEVSAFTINDIYKEHSESSFPFIVKIDIEGGEKDLFSQNVDWVSKTPCIIIELHDWLLPKGGTSRSFLQCISQLDRDFIFIGENVFSIANNLDEIYENAATLSNKTTEVSTPEPLLKEMLDTVASSLDSPDRSNSIEYFIEQAEVAITLNQLGAAADFYRLALALESNNPECLLKLSALLMRIKCHEECFHHVRHFIRLVDDVALGYFIAGYAAREIGRWRESRSYLLRAVELDPSHVYARVLCCMSLFTVCMDETEAESILHSYVAELDQLVRNTALETPEQIDNAVDGIGALAPFFLPYLGCNVKNLQTKYGSWICSVMAAKFPQFTHPLPQRSSNGKIKIGIVSNYFYNHSNWKIPIKGWLEQLDRQSFSIHCFHTGEVSDMATESARSLADSFLQSSDIETVATTIREQQFDVLIYPGIGMETVTLKLAALRLAPVQCSSWGHPVTTGMPTVDYFISSDLMEPADGAEHYTEKLVRLPNLSIWYEPAEPKLDVASALAIPGLEKHDVMFLCSQNLLKYLPQYDFIFPVIAGQVESVRFVFIASYVTELTDKFMQRLDRAFQNRGLLAADYVNVLPQLNEADFAALNSRADIFLDSIEWSGCNTVFESLPFNTPVVTLSGTFMRGRHAYAILKMMGVEETIAASVDDYISIAVRLANDLRWRKDISDRIHRNKHRIYRDSQCIAGLETFLKNVAGGNPGQIMPSDTISGAESGDAEAWFKRGISYMEEGRYLDAEAAYYRAIALKPDYAEAHLSLGNLLYSLGRIGEAETVYRRIIDINPEYGKAYCNLGILLYGLGRFDEAEASYQQAISKNPGYDKAYSNQGILLSRLGRFAEAREVYRQAIAINPNNEELHCNLGDVLVSLGCLDEAVMAYRQSISIKPEYAEAYNSLGIAVGLLCRPEEAVWAFRRAIVYQPDFAVAHGNLLLTMQYISSFGHEKTFVEALNFGKCFEAAFKGKRKPYANIREAGKRLKIGIVSGNLCDHPVGYFLEGVIKSIDLESMALYAYANQLENDRLSERIKPFFEEWLFVKAMSDEELAARIGDDGIDILIDLAGHTSGNRLLTFMYKPAPVQVTWLGYPNTTGLSSIDYILADPITVPLHEEKYYTETVWRLPDTYICFTPPDLDLEVNRLPALENGYIIFGCFNNPVKITDDVIACWAEILRAVPNSVLLLKIRQAITQYEVFAQRFSRCGIDPARLRFEGTMGSRDDLIASYQRIDIALDPFPYNGTTTTCEAAWMGVPTLTLKMPRGIYSYNGELIMRSVGLADWVADSVEGYVGAARKVTLDIAQLARIRSGLREILLNSPICDAPRFANNLQLALRGMWQQWCVKPDE